MKIVMQQDADAQTCACGLPDSQYYIFWHIPYIQNFNVQNPVVSAIFDIEIIVFSVKLEIHVFTTRK